MYRSGFFFEVFMRMRSSVKLPKRNYKMMSVKRAEELGFYDGTVANAPEHLSFRSYEKRRAYVRGYRLAQSYL
jgi:hypothetical protein